MAVSGKQAASKPGTEERLAALWAGFCDASRAAQASLRIEDGIVAGHAWREWLDAFVPVPSVTPGALPKPLPGGSR